MRPPPVAQRHQGWFRATRRPGLWRRPSACV